MTDDSDRNTIWYTRCPLPTALSFAYRTGILARHIEGSGFTLLSLKGAASREMRQSHFDNTLPGMIRQGGNVPPIWSRSKGRDIRLVGLSWTNEAQLVLTLPETGIDTIAALRGRRLALPVRPNYPVDHWRASVLSGYENVLSHAGLVLSDVTLVEIEIPDEGSEQREEADGSALKMSRRSISRSTLSAQRYEARALIRGEVDALFAPGHYGVALSEFLGASVVADLSAEPDRLKKINNFTLLALTMEGGLVDRDPDVAERIVIATLDAAEWARRNAEEAARIVAAESGNAEDLVTSIFGADFAGDLAPGFSDEQVDALERQISALHRNGIISAKIAASSWIDRRLLEKATARWSTGGRLA
ncbi:hypothetical protein ACO34A_24100 (plasmid) [Rhizobium sp. ACO-34A]|nr:ABC transporter substrate-binding protein [Rhizobium sp. ACO-34A]ATN36862.1 hypothetical protein ACO34A_24100 [Rhizobium sp. ACO-34A]